MTEQTDNHNWTVPTTGDFDYDDTFDTWFDDVDRAIEIRDKDANKGGYDPKSNALYVATDTGSVYLGDGSSWNLVDRDVATLSANTVDANGGTIVDGAGVSHSGELADISDVGGGGTSWTQVTKTSDYTAANDESVWADSSSSAVTITLPTPSSDAHVRVLNIDNANGVTVSENGSEKINDQSGSQSTISLADGESITVESDGNTWWIV